MIMKQVTLGELLDERSMGTSCWKVGNNLIGIDWGRDDSTVKVVLKKDGKGSFVIQEVQVLD